MSKNPLALHFLLEVLGLAALAYGAWNSQTGLLQPLLGIGVPVLAAVAWGTFRVPNDPGAAPVKISGWLRLLLEALFFASASFLLYVAGQSNLALLFGISVLIDYALGYDRVLWLIKQ